MSYCGQCGKELKDEEICDCQKNENCNNNAKVVIVRKQKNKKRIILITAIVLIIITILIFFVILSGTENNKEILKGSVNIENFVLENAFENLEATEKDFEDLENMLEGLSYIVNLEFDSSIVSFENIFSNLMKDSYYFFENTIEEIYDVSEQKADPQNKLYYEYNGKKIYSYFKLNGEEIDWISKETLIK